MDFSAAERRLVFAEAGGGEGGKLERLLGFPRRGFSVALWVILVDVCSGGGGEVVPGVALTLPRACCLRGDPDRSCELLGRFPGHLLVPGCHNLVQAWKD